MGGGGASAPLNAQLLYRSGDIFFFFRKKFQSLFTLNFDFSRFDLFHFNFSALLLLKGRRTALSNSKILKVTKNVIDY